MKNITVILVVALVLIAGCTTTQKGAATGAAAGAALGGIIGHQSGKTAEGAGIGAAAGAAAGALIGEQMDKKFCPECGRRFTTSKNYCPVDGAELKLIDK
jgi:uncharacterized protein YcfJ